MDLREVGYDDRDWINLAQDRDRWRAYAKRFREIDYKPGYGPTGSYRAEVKIEFTVRKASALLSRLNLLPADLELSSGVGSIPAWADYLVLFFPKFSPTVRRMSGNLWRIHGLMSFLAEAQLEHHLHPQ
ncbi:hypothetical protein ANN_26478 [Periplaneta americana]|uniref:Per a allergen n=1 Tax=Periplaneta americana TaxID=6978 RepID=A0ABQ8RYG8_PERAM|nr:hypothetical protein ANN_26478 [Periplaneta americana]